jgi:hypothetical protein
MPAVQDVGFLAEGNLKFGLLAADGVTPIGYYSSKNTTTFAYNPGSPTVKQRISKLIGQYGQIKDQVAIPKPSELTMGFDTIDAQGIATICRGDMTSLSQTGATVAAATFAVTNLDLYVPIGTQRFVSAVTVTNTAASTTYVEGTDYDVDYSLGLIIFYSTGAIAVGNIKVGYTYATYAGTLVHAEKFTQLNMQIHFDGKNLANGKYLDVYIPKAVMAPSKAIDFMSEDFTVAELTGSPIALGNSSPVIVKYIDTVPAGF